MRNPILLDTTLRDGEQSPGVYFTRKNKLIIASKLDELGIPIIEAGIPSMGEEECATFKALKKLNLHAEILAWNRLLECDVMASLKANAEHVHLSVPTSDIMLQSKIGKTKEWLTQQMEKVFGLAIRHDLQISFGAEDSSRTDPAFLKQLFVLAQELGAKRIRVADTLGIMTPDSVAQLISSFKPELTIPIDFHGHNDFGLASANALSAWNNGSDIISCSVLGLGERAGNTSLEEFAGILHYLKGDLLHFNFLFLNDLCKLVAEWTGCSVSERKPLFGSNIYMHESGIHVDGLLKNPSNYEFFAPELFGKERKLVVGKHSGRSAVRYLAKNKGYTLSNDQIAIFLKEMRSRMSVSEGVDASALFNSFLHTHALKVRS